MTEEKKEKKISDQQVQTDHRIEEILPKDITCPRCDSQAKQVLTKRGVHIKCTVCDYDSNQVFDFSKNRRRSYVFECMKLLKNNFPLFNFAENIPYNPDIIYTWDVEPSKTKYDIKIFWMGQKIARVRIELNKHLTQEQYYHAKECYIIGRREIVEYLHKRDAIIVHYLIDEPDENKKLLMSRVKEIMKHGTVNEDRFHNWQYFIPLEKRELLVKKDRRDMIRLITADIFEKIYENIRIL